MADGFESFIATLGDGVSVRWLITLLHFLWQGAIVGGVVAIAGKLMRSASAGTRYALYSAALLSLPVCVAVTFCIVAVPVSSQSSSQPGSSADISAKSPTFPSQATATTAAIQSEPAAATDTPRVGESGVAVAAALKTVADDDSESLSHSAPAWFSRAAPWIAVAYVVGVACFLLRLLAALWGGHRLRTSTSRVTDAELLKLIADQATRVKLKCVPVVAYCERVAVPTVVGVLRPMVLLPVPLMTGMTPDDFAAIIRHEFAHIRRYDLWMNLLQRVIESLLFFHPVVWFISRRLSAEREVCCDDLVVSSGYEPMHYAGALLRMAELCAFSRQPGALELAATGDKTPLLEKRIERLMNWSNTRPLRLTRAGMAGFLMTLVSLMVVPGIVHTWAQAQAQEPVQLSDGDLGSLDQKEAVGNANTPAIEVAPKKSAETALHGMVVGPTGEPFENAQIWISNLGHDSKRWTRRPQPEVKWTRVAESDAAGRFSATLNRAMIGQAADGQKNILVAATAEGFGFGLVDVNIQSLAEEISLQLVKDQRIEGRIMTLDGRPAAGVSVGISTLPWDVPDVEQVIKSAPLSSGVYTNWPSRRGGPPLSEPMLTDVEGRFRLEGMGIDRYVRLEVFGGGIGASRLLIITHPTPNERLPSGVIAVREGLRESTYYARFVHVGTPSRTIRGVVTDKESGDPIEGVEITEAASWKLRARPTVTDSDGRFELPHVSQRSKYELTFDPSTTHHCNMRVLPEDTDGTGPLTLNVSLHRGIVARGRLTDPETGEPVQGTVEYNPLFPNENWRKLGAERVANPAATATTDEDGSWELAVLSGPGAIAATTNNARYVKARVKRDDLEALAEDIEAPGDQAELRILQPAAGDQRRGIMALGQAVALINPGPGTRSLDVDLEFVVGRTRRVAVVDESGEPVSGVEAVGLGNYAEQRNPQESDSFEVRGLVPGRRRQLLFLHPNRKLGAALEVTGDELTPLTVQLVPTGTLTGRFVDELGEPIPNGYVSLHVRTPDKTSLSTGLWGSSLDDDGRFRIDGVIAGCEYGARTQVPEHRVNLHVPIEVEVEPGQSCDIGEFMKEDEYRFKPSSMK